MECPECGGKLYPDCHNGKVEIPLYENRGVVIITLNQIGEAVIYTCEECEITFAVQEGG